MASYHRILNVFERSIEDKTLQCDCDIHPWEILVNGDRWSGRLRLIGFVDIFFLISYSENSRFHEGIVIYKDDQHIEKLLNLAGKEFKDEKLTTKTPNSEFSNPKTTTPTPTTNPNTSQLPKPTYTTFTRDTADYTCTSIGHSIGLRTRYAPSSLQTYTIHLRKPTDPLLKRKYKRALKVHDTLDMIHDAVKLGLVSYAEILGSGMGHIYRGSSALQIGKRFVGGLGEGNRNEGWMGLSGDKG
ncbi:hypothetical protein SBOR_5191 [Sclerotinia borealis F-4128]|uniref:Uncharacterized protein n=1 Tax=Sclerotinia borealis (strain F-4128) TaxID=1432307 RepID=W9CEU2_SCLBF|nr:hypothetical protein SBOR_5191 [Sclerotinia borealis F-4128]